MKGHMSRYKEAGVDIEKGDRFTDFIKNFGSHAILKGIGGFSGGIELDLKKFRRPVLLSTTDGVGTKLLVAKKCKTYTTIGIDLVAMCVNDLIMCGAEPLIFLDYIACGKIHEKVLQDIMKGIIRGCEIAHLKLAGGETAEMPDMYNTDDVDLAGFAVGIGEKEELLPKINLIREGDIIFGLPSSGIHSNGFSLARKVIPEGEKRLWEELLVTPFDREYLCCSSYYRGWTSWKYRKGYSSLAFPRAFFRLGKTPDIFGDTAARRY
jgi:phosphoribosylformylglycinamidine cyclo-ligase